VCVCIYIHICISFFRFEGDFSSSYIARPGNSKREKKRIGRPWRHASFASRIAYTHVYREKR
jgi:hypothetical protein